MSKQIHVGAVAVGGGAPVSIQSMCNTPTQDVERTVSQILRLEQAGCQIIRVAVPDMDAARAIGPIRRRIHIPLVADIHFDYQAWPWNASARGWTRSASTPATSAPRKRSGPWPTPAGTGAFPSASASTAAPWSGSCCKNTAASPPQALVDSALGHVRLLNDCNFDDICISVKCSHVPVNMAAYQHAPSSRPTTPCTWESPRPAPPAWGC